jgi:Na+/H+-dicarboxylate symporter
LSIFQRILSLSFSKQVTVALAAGVALGLFFGEMIAPIAIVSQAFINLLQMTVLPYVTVSIMTGLGTLSKQQSRMIFTKVGGLLLLFWVLTLGLVFLIPFAFPRQESASFFSSSIIEQPKPFDFLELYIPTNPFFSLANNIVPAVVFFSVAVGIALIGIESKQQLISWLEIAQKALGEVSKFIVKLTPIGLFAIGATMAGTLRLQDLQRVEIYLLIYAICSTLLTLWILPALISAVTTIPYLEILKRTGGALITAFMTANLFIVLPMLSETSKELLRRFTKESKDAESLTDVIVPTSFSFPHSGKILSISFILFAAWFSDISFSLLDNLKLAVTGILTFFGNINAAVPYLLDFFRIPIDTFQLFLALGVLNSRFGSAIAAMHTLALAVLGACAMSKMVTIRTDKLIRYLVITILLTAITFVGMRFLFEHIVDNRYKKDQVLQSMQLLKSKNGGMVYRDMNQVPAQKEIKSESVLDEIDARHTIRVGYLPDSLPYCFFNSKNDLVGFDVDMAHQLAEELNVSLEFVPMERTKIVDQLNTNYCDVLMSGMAVSIDRAKEITFSTTYLQENAAFIVPDFRRKDFETRDSILKMHRPRIGVINLPYYLNKAREYAPNAELVTIKSPSDYFEGKRNDLDAFLLSAQRGSTWCLLYPKFSVVVPDPPLITVPLAYGIAQNDPKLLGFVNTWLELKKDDRTIDDLYDYWILGKNAESREPRWSIIRNVLHWTQ